MGVAFYPQNKHYWTQDHHVGMPNLVFDILQNLLQLDPEMGNFGHINTSELLQKVDQAERELRQHGPEWEYSPEPADEDGNDFSLIILEAPGVKCTLLYHYLTEIKELCLFTNAHNTAVMWS